MHLFFSIICFIRPFNIFLGILTCFLVSYLIDFNNFYRFIDLCVVLIFYMIGANILNDIVDIEIDRINKPHRFLVQHPINKLYIFITIIVLFTFGTWNTLKLPPLAQQLVLFFILPAIILYEFFFKRLPLLGNIIISLLVGSVFIYAEASLTGEIVITWKIFILAFILNLIREIIKDIQDIKGDATNNFKTLPIVAGIPLSIIILRILSLIFIIISMHPIYIQFYSFYYIPLILFSIHVPLLYIMWRLRVSITSKECDNFSNILKLMIINGIIIILLSS